MFQTVNKQSLSEAVYDQLRARILSRELAAGDELPSERILCDMLGVNRGAVREGIKRLQQAGLVQVRHGGPTVILDFEREAGLEMLPALLVDDGGNMRVDVARGIVRLRQVLAPEVARQAAARADSETAARLTALVADMRATPEPARRQALSFEFWDVLVSSSGNIAYRLAFNSLRKTYQKIWGLLTQTLAVEFGDLDGFAALAAAVEAGDADTACAVAEQHVELGSRALGAVLDAYAAGRAGEGAAS